MNEQASLLFALQVVALTRRQIEALFGISTLAANKRLAILRNKHRLVRIVGWMPQPEGVRGKRSPVYAYGDPADDVSEPPRVSSAKRNKAYRDRNRDRFRELRKSQNQRQRARVAARRNALWSQLLW